MTRPGFPTAVLPTVLLSALLAVGNAAAQQAAPIDFAEALRQAATVSGSVRGAQLDTDSKRLKAEALEHIDGPSLNLTGFAGRVQTSIGLDVSRAAGAINGIGGALPLPLPLPEVPDTLTHDSAFNLGTVGIGALWPLYTGGRLDAVKGVAGGQVLEADADRVEAEDKLALQVAQRYFTLQLAQQVARVRARAAAGVAEHQQAAKKLEAGGLIAHAERLRADVALDSANSAAAQAASDVELAQVALNRLLGAATTVRPATPLFVHSTPVGPLQSFIDAGMTHNPAWAKIAGKRMQAEQSRKLHGSEHSPTVFALGNYNYNKSKEGLVGNNWFVGVAVNIPLVDRIDKSKLIAAARLDEERVEVAAQQAGRDIPTLIEKNWRALEQARIEFLATGSSLELARENLRLQQIAFREGQAAALDEVDAQLNLAKIETQRANAAYGYVMALAQLLDASGQPRRLPELAKTADIVIPLEGE